MEAVPMEIHEIAEMIVTSVGGGENISSIVAGKRNLLSISVKHFDYILKQELERAFFINDLVFGSHWVTMHLKGVSARDVEIAIRLYENEQKSVTIMNRDDGVKWLDLVFSYLRTVFTPLLSLIIAGGILQIVIILLITLGFFASYTNEAALFSTISGAVYFTLPIMLAFSGARQQQTNPYISVAIAGILLHPNVSSFISEMILENFLGFSLLSESYTNSVLPILFLIPFQASMERSLQRSLPNVLQPLLKPFLILAAGLGLGIFVFSPIMTLIGNAIVGLLQYLLEGIPWLATALMGAGGPIFVTIGAHYSLFPMINEAIHTQGFEVLLGPGMLVMNAAHAGVALAVLLETTKKEYRVYSGSAFVMALLGVSQPTIYGIEVLLKKPFLAAIFGGGAGGLLAGILGVRAYKLVNPNLLSLSSFEDGSGNLWKALFCMLVSFFLTFWLTKQMKFEEPADEEIKIAASGIEQIPAQKVE